jgi:hypothetical protein
MKKSDSFYLDKEVVSKIKEKAKADNRSKSDWLNLHLIDLFSKPEKPLLPAIKVGKYIPPTLQEVIDYCRERMNFVDPQSFIDHYTANGWMRGKAKVKDWRACVRTWEKNSKQNKGSQDFSDDSTDWVNRDYGLI